MVTGVGCPVVLLPVLGFPVTGGGVEGFVELYLVQLSFLWS